MGLTANSRRQLHAARLVTVLAMYQADHGKPPASLGDLVPAYLTTLPDDPSTGRAFAYRISKGETIAGPRPVVLAPGQAIIGTEDRQVWLPVPTWTR